GSGPAGRFRARGPYTTWRGHRPVRAGLLRLAVLGVLAAARAEFLQRQPIGIVALVLFRVVVALFTVGTRPRDQDAVCFLGHGGLSLGWGSRREEPKVRIELTTSPLPRVCSTTELLGPEAVVRILSGGVRLPPGSSARAPRCPLRRRRTRAWRPSWVPG